MISPPGNPCFHPRSAPGQQPPLNIVSSRPLERPTTVITTHWPRNTVRTQNPPIRPCICIFDIPYRKEAAILVGSRSNAPNWLKQSASCPSSNLSSSLVRCGLLPLLPPIVALLSNPVQTCFWAVLCHRRVWHAASCELDHTLFHAESR